MFTLTPCGFAEDMSPSADFFNDLDDLRLCIPRVLHYRSPLALIMQENPNCQWYDIKGGLHAGVPGCE